APARPGLRPVPRRLWRRADLRRAFPPGRCADHHAGQPAGPCHRRSGLGAEHGAAAVAADAADRTGLHYARAAAAAGGRVTPLGAILAARIRAHGPMRLDEYMQACLLHPEHGYYTTREPFGTEGDFTTAPEISQMFGEMLGAALAQAWLDQGRPAHAVLAEIGPGRGTLMADTLRVLRRVPGWRAEVWLVEASPRLRALQRELLGAVRHVDTVADLPEAPLFLL